jgi:hypothetical protein
MGVADRGEFVWVADKVDRCDDAVLRRHRHHLFDGVTSREDGACGAADDGWPGGQVTVSAGHSYEQAGHPAGTDDRAASGPAFGTTVGNAYDLRRQAGDDLVHVAGSQRTEQAADEFAVGRGGLAGLLFRPEPAAGPAGDLPACRLGASHRGSDLGVGHLEYVRQHENRPLDRCQLVEQHQEAEGQGVGQLGRALRAGISHDRLGQPWPGVDLPGPRRGAEPVEAKAGGCGDQPGLGVGDVCAAGRLPAQPGVLGDVVGVGQGAEHPIGQAADPGPGRLERILAHVAVVTGNACTARRAAACPLARAASAIRPVGPTQSPAR